MVNSGYNTVNIGSCICELTESLCKDCLTYWKGNGNIKGQCILILHIVP